MWGGVGGGGWSLFNVWDGEACSECEVGGGLFCMWDGEG